MGQQISVAAAAQRLYRGAPPVARTLQSLRPYICPFDDLLACIPPAAHMLDVGCGAGLLLGLVADRYPETSGIGFDTSGSAIAAARKMAASNGFENRMMFEQRAVGEAWPSGPFDVVSMVDVLHHIPRAHQHRVIEQCFAHVRPGGILLYKDMGQRPVFSALWNRAHDLVLARQWIHYRAVTEVCSWLGALGADVVRTDARSMGPYAHELVVAKRSHAA
jgi:2-polyprenyl-3-methyl-5-hydroxy-6-metoxy-1,4-benzoquinol methylase